MIDLFEEFFIELIPNILELLAVERNLESKLSYLVNILPGNLYLSETGKVGSKNLLLDVLYSLFFN